MITFIGFMSQRFIVILVYSPTQLAFVIICKKPVFSRIQNSLDIKSIRLELLRDYKTLGLWIWFSSLENLLGLIVFAALITDFFIN